MPHLRLVLLGIHILFGTAAVVTGLGALLASEPVAGADGRLRERAGRVFLACVRELRPLPSGDYTVVLTSGASLVMSRSHRDELLRRLG